MKMLVGENSPTGRTESRKLNVQVIRLNAQTASEHTEF